MVEREGAMGEGTELGVIPRILFATDGAITHIVEAYAGETIDLVPLSSRLTDGTHVPGRGLAAGERALRRLILLRGRVSRRPFVHRESVVALDRLPAGVAEELVGTGAGLLDVLARQGIGTFRETVDDWEEEDEAVAAQLGLAPSQILLGRTYHVVVGGRPVAWVTERFPRDGFPERAADDPVPTRAERSA